MRNQYRDPRVKLVECVPNFSEGRNRAKIKQITQSIKRVKKIKVLDVESDKDHHRTVITFIGSPEDVFQAAFNAIKKAAEIIDMRRHRGRHPRIGSVDVCPFIPIQNMTMKECVDLAKKLAKKVGQSLNIPVYLYAEASRRSFRKTLPQIREGEYEGLAEKMKLKKWQPDFGPKKLNLKSGAIAIGARNFLIAFNVNLKSRDLALAKEIAARIRESGSQRQRPGEFKELKALGLPLQEQDFVQVSMNLTNFKITSLHAVFERIKELAGEKGVKIASSELVGLAPLEAILESGRFYRPAARSQEEIIEAAIKNMRLGKFSKFEPKRKIIEFAI